MTYIFIVFIDSSVEDLTAHVNMCILYWADFEIISLKRGLNTVCRENNCLFPTFKDFLDMPSKMYDKLLQRVTVEIGATDRHRFTHGIHTLRICSHTLCIR